MIQITTSEKISLSLCGKFGTESRRWKGDNASYAAKHMWIIKHYGRALKCGECGVLNASRYEWANISGEYKREVSDYMELCPSCHRKLDLRKPFCKHGHLFTEENTYIDTRGFRQCKDCRKNASRRYKDHAKVNKIPWQAVE